MRDIHARSARWCRPRASLISALLAVSVWAGCGNNLGVGESRTFLDRDFALTPDGAYLVTLLEQEVESQGTPRLERRLLALRLDDGTLSVGDDLLDSQSQISVLPHPDSRRLYLVEAEQQSIVRVLELELPQLRVVREISFAGEFASARLAPDGRTLVLYSGGSWLQRDGRSRRPEVLIIDLETAQERLVTLAAPLLHLDFAPDGAALYTVASEEFDRVCQSGDSTAADYAVELSRIDLRGGPRLPAARPAADRLLPRGSEDRLVLRGVAHGIGGITPSLSISPRGDQLAIAACDQIDTSACSCAGKLFFVDLPTFALRGSVPAIGQAAYTPDGATVVAWDGTRNELGQVQIPFGDDDGRFSAEHDHWLVFVDTDTLALEQASLAFFNPVYHVTPVGGLVVTVGIYFDNGEHRLVITDLDTNQTTVVAGDELGLTEFVSLPDGSALYSIESGALYQLDLIAASAQQIFPDTYAGNAIDLLPGAKRLVVGRHDLKVFDVIELPAHRIAQSYDVISLLPPATP